MLIIYKVQCYAIDCMIFSLLYTKMKIMESLFFIKGKKLITLIAIMYCPTSCHIFLARSVQFSYISWSGTDCKAHCIWYIGEKNVKQWKVEQNTCFNKLWTHISFLWSKENSGWWTEIKLNKYQLALLWKNNIKGASKILQDRY